jgi:hypothetical protein
MDASVVAPDCFTAAVIAAQGVFPSDVPHDVIGQLTVELVEITSGHCAYDGPRLFDMRLPPRSFRPLRTHSHPRGGWAVNGWRAQSSYPASGRNGETSCG